MTDQPPLFPELDAVPEVDADDAKARLARLRAPLSEVDGAPIPADQVLDDEALHRGGLRPVRAWMRTKASGNALRQHRKREKAEDQGRRQLNVVLPSDEPTREVVKALAERLTDGSLPLADVRALVELGAVVEKQASSRPVSPPVSDPVRQVVEEIAGRLAAGTISLDVVRRVLSGPASDPPPAPGSSSLRAAEARRIGERVLALTGWRRTIVFALIGKS